MIGGTGSGKSSIVNLIPRFYDVSTGEILVNDINVKKYRVEDLRNIIGLVPQNPTLFEGTIRSNMCWRKPDATDDEIIKKAEGAEIDLEAQIEKLAARYKGKSTGDLYKDRAKCMRFLMNRGYPLQLCDKILTKGDFFK